MKSEITEPQDMEARLARAEHRARTASAIAALTLGGTVLLNLRPAALAQTPEVSLASLLSRLSAVEQKTAPISVSGTDLTVTGVNIHVVNGTGAVNGLGNLIIGYNTLRGNFTDARTGSHNLILGDQDNYTAYGSLVSGFSNASNGAYDDVLTGEFNTASGGYSCVTSGAFNAASSSGCVTAGEFNAASSGASVTGGQNNTASGGFSSVSGGNNLTAGTMDGRKAGSQAATTIPGNFTSP